MTTAQKIQFSGKGYTQHYKYWKAELERIDGGFIFQQNAAKGTSEVRVMDKQLDVALTNTLLSSVNQDQRGIWVFMLSAFGLVFSRYSNEVEVAFDVPPFESQGTEKASSLPFRVAMDASKSTRELLRSTKSKIADFFNYQELPQEAVLDRYAGLRTANNNILLSHNQLHGSLASQSHDLHIAVNHENGQLKFQLAYKSETFETFLIEGLWKHFVKVLEQFPTKEKSLTDVQMLSENELSSLLNKSALSSDVFSFEKSILGLFNSQVNSNPKATASRDSNGSITYQTMDDASNKLAAHLMKQGVGKGSVVAFALDTSVDVVVTILGILKSHAAFLPIDVSFPTNRIKTILEVSKADLLVTSSERMFEIDYYQGPLFAIDIELPVLPEIDNFDLPVIEAEDPAYMIFTSGSSGKPKGVVVPHRAIANYINWVLTDFEMSTEHCSVLLSSHAFDLCYTAFWGALLSGGGLHLLDEATRKSPKEILQYLEQQKIRFIKTTPSQFSMLRNAMMQNPAIELNDLELIFLGGEPINVKEVQSHLSTYPTTTFVNHYGPTETTVGTIFHVITIENLQDFCEQPVVGKPITNNGVRIVGDHGSLQPVGIWGEICIVGSGVASGYKDRPDLTAEKFHADLWESDLTMYHTGDKGRWLQNGTIALSGRFDDQVKVRGFRVEPGEIAKTIAIREDVGEAVILAQQEHGDTALHGFVVPSTEEKIFSQILETQKEISSDWAGASPAELCQLPNGLSLFYPLAEELKRLFNFSDEGYFQLDISLPENPTVVDVGAGSGVFSIPVGIKYPGANILAIEASPLLGKLLQYNFDSYGLNGTLSEVLLSDQDGTTDFSFFPHAPALSAMGADMEKLEQIVRNNILANANSDNLEDNKFFMEDAVKKALRSEVMELKTARLSEILRKHKVNTVDLLKINIEEGTANVLAGIDEEDWAIIKQIVIRVRNNGNDVERTKRLLVDKGFGVAIEEAENFTYDNVKTLYAVKEIPDVVADQKPMPKFNVQGTWTDPELYKRALQDHATEVLPDYMIPETWTVLSALPVNQNGKIDKPTLFSEIAKGQAPEEEIEAPANDIESALLEIWQEVLQKDQFGVTHNFFKIGGHSLKAVQVSTRVFERLGFELDIKEVFEQPTVRELAKILEDKSEKDYLPIPKLSKEECYNASHAQQRLWILDALLQENTAYNQPRAFRISGTLDLKALTESLVYVINRHESLRTVFKFKEGTLKQFIQEHLDISKVFNVVVEADENALDEHIDEACNHVFDLEKGPLIKTTLLTGESVSHLVLNTHHIICDGQSIEVLLAEWMTVYEQLSKNRKASLPNLPIQYKDYASWQHVELENEAIQGHREYWLKQFEKVTPVLKLPVDHPKSGNTTRKGANLIFPLQEISPEALNVIAAEEQVSPFMIFVSTLKVLLYRYTEETDVTIGTPVNGRNHKDLEGQIGFFLNMLPLRSQLSGNSSLKDVLNLEKQVILDAFDHQVYPFDRMVKDLKLDRVQDQSPLFDVVLSYQDLSQEQQFAVEGLEVLSLESGDTESKYDLTFNLSFDGTQFNLVINYDRNLFDHSTISTLANHFQSILSSLVSDTKVRVGELNFLTSAEIKELLEIGGDQPVTLAPDTIHERWEQQVLKNQYRTAIVCEDRVITYGEVNRRANRLANRLLSLEKFEQSNCVGLLVGRSEQMVIGMLGILKAGGAYLPLDPGFPQDRLKYMLEDSGVDLLVTGDVEYISSDHVEVIDLKDQELESAEDHNPKIQVSPEDLAYIIYTSGSTGHPKGVEIRHQSVVNFLIEVGKKKSISPQDRVLAATTIAFDISIFDLIFSLTNGAQAIVVSKEDREDPMLLSQELTRTLPTMIHLTPSMWNMLLMSDWQGDQAVTAFSGGEPLTNDLAARIKTLCGPLWNFYGPTEATVYSSMKAIEDPKAVITVGSPLGNNAFYVLGKQGQLLPKGVAGELYIGGASLAKGYHNRSELTADRFVELTVPEKRRLYKTGDVAQWNMNDELEVLGRNDDQVKIRGHRVEIGEIENALTKLKDIHEAAVALRTLEKGQKILIAWLLSDVAIDLKQTKAQLHQFLPGHMVPDHILIVEQFPRTNNGKVNKRELTFDQITNGQSENVFPRNDSEERISKLWSEVLGHDDFGVHDNFFSCGGHSLGAAHLNMLLKREFQIDSTLRDIFENPTIATLAFRVIQTNTISQIEIVPAPLSETYPVSNAQRRMWMLQSLAPDATQYHLDGTFHIEGEIDVARLEEAFKKVIARHEILRTNFDQIDGELRQIIRNNLDQTFQIQNEDFKTEDQRQAFISSLTDKPYDLTTDTLIRIGLLKMDDRKNVLVISMHHIIADDLSLQVMFRDLTHYYQQKDGLRKPLPELSIQYKDFSHWQQQQLSGQGLKKLQAYWLRQFSDQVPILALPRETGAEVSGQGKKIDLELNDEHKAVLESLARKEEGTTLFMTLVASVKALLAYYTGNNDMVLGMPVSGRNHHQLTDQVGCFINTLPIRTRLDLNKPFSELLKTVRTAMVGAMEHQDYPYDQLLEDLRNATGETVSNLFEVMVSYQDLSNDVAANNDLKIEPLNDSEPKARFELSFNFWKNGETLGLSIIYDKNVFIDSLMNVFAEHYYTLLDLLCDLNSEGGINQITLGEIELLSPANKKELLNLSQGDKVSYPKNETVLDLLEEQVSEHPHALATIWEFQGVTYDKLNKLSDAFAMQLLKKGVQPGDHVGLSVKRSLEMIVAALGILKAGAAYVPLDPDYASGRILHMVDNSQLEWVVIRQEDQPNTEFFSKTIDIELRQLPQEIKNLDLPKMKPEQTFAILYTSGSTGTPKGVVITHGNVMARMHYLLRQYPFQPGDTTLFYRSYGFDASLEEFLYPILTGGACCVASSNIKNDLLHNISVLVRDRLISKINMPPSMLTEMIQWSAGREYFESLKYVVSGGERLKVELVNDFIARFGEILYNAYGPTENTDDSTVWKAHMLDNQAVPIGIPIDNSSVYVVNSYGNLMPKGAHGELWVGGAGLSGGYLNLPEQTEEKFVRNPFGTGKLYKTGDHARWLPDGNIEFLGRNDEQVKIRGFRIELNEIEHALSHAVQIETSSVQLFTSPRGVKEIIAFIVLKDGSSVNELTKNMGGILPSYMLPSRYFEIEELPRNAHGKLDKRRLQEIYAGQQQEVIDEELSPTEKRVLEIWSEVLGINQVSKKDQFFDIGGHSINAFQVISRVHKHFGVKLSLKDLFSRPTLETLAEHLDGLKSEVYEELSPAPIQKDYPLTHSQKRMWLQSQWHEKLTAYNLPSAWELIGPFDPEFANQAFQNLIEKYEILRTNFYFLNGEPRQRIHGPEETTFIPAYEDLSHLNQKDQYERLVALKSKATSKSFDLENDALIQVTILCLSDEKHIVFLNLHHIIYDGWSEGILIQEWSKNYESLYKGESSSVTPLTYQYKDYAYWQHSNLEEGKLAVSKVFWNSTFKNDIPLLQLPLDHSRRADKKFTAYKIPVRLTVEESESLEKLAISHGATLFTTILSMYAVLLHKWSGDKSLVIGTPVSGRDRIEFENQIGLFLNSLPLRLEVEPNCSFDEQLTKVHKSVQEMLLHQHYPLDLILEDLNLEAIPGRSPLFDCGFTWQNASKAGPDEELNSNIWSELEIRKLERENNEVKTDCWLHGGKYPDGTIGFSFSFDKELFREATAKKITGKFQALIRRICASPEQAIVELPFDVTPKSIKNMQRGSIDLSGFAQNPIEETKQKTLAKGFPLVISAVKPGLNLANYLADHKSELEQKLLSTGAVLLRGFAVDHLDKFHEAAAVIGDQPMNYMDQSSPRTGIGKSLYTSTDHPADQVIQMHSELSYSVDWPMQILFHCQLAAAKGGQTPLSDNRIVMQNLPAAIIEKFETNGVKYVRNLMPGVGLSWQQVYQTNDKSVVEKYCEDNGIDCDWRSDDHLRVSWNRPAFRMHPIKEEKIWFNHAFFFNAANLVSYIHEVVNDPWDMPSNTFYGDGTPIDAETIEMLTSAYDKAKVIFDWRNGDVLLLDNMLIAHGRNAYEGGRKIFVAMNNPHSALLLA